jgi:galactosamine-6-phosphate isomerase
MRKRFGIGICGLKKSSEPLRAEIYNDNEVMSATAAAWLEERVRVDPELLMCLATGATPTRTYELLARRPKKIFSRARVLKLDEWGGIPLESDATCETFLRRTIVEPLRLEKRYVGFQSEPTEPNEECQRIAGWLRDNGPIDVCVLGLGLNGHLGFNEPADWLQPNAHVATLSAESLSHSMLSALEKKPTYGLTLGIADILQSREILLLVSGAAKAKAMRQLFEEEVTTRFPASFLWLHPNVTIMCDKAAAAEIV